LLASAQGGRDQELARLLADIATQQTAVDRIVASGNEKVSLLISWTRTPPVDLDEFHTYIFRSGLAEVFGRLKTKEAIPFLVQNIGLKRWPLVGPVFTKAPEVVYDRMPAVAALIRIGPDALRALTDAPYRPSTLEDRLAVIFVVSRVAATMPDKDGARQFLTSALRNANLERFWAEECLKFSEGPGQAAP
jgi:hypothetical protein